MRIGELAEHVGVPADTIRFYERAGWLPRPVRRENGYRAYRASDVEHLRMLIDLRRLELPLEDAARLASWCHAGHCSTTTSELPALIAERRSELAERIGRLRDLDDRLADLERHVAAAGSVAARGVGAPTFAGRVSLVVIEGPSPCCDAAAAVTAVTEGACACCAAEPAPLTQRISLPAKDLP